MDNLAAWLTTLQLTAIQWHNWWPSLKMQDIRAVSPDQHLGPPCKSAIFDWNGRKSSWIDINKCHLRQRFARNRWNSNIFHLHQIIWDWNRWNLNESGSPDSWSVNSGTLRNGEEAALKKQVAWKSGPWTPQNWISIYCQKAGDIPNLKSGYHNFF